MHRFPKVKINPRLLRCRYKGYYLTKQPLREINPRDFQAVRIKTEPCRQGWFIMPEYSHNNKWYVFRLDDKPFILLVKELGWGSFKSASSLTKKDNIKKLLKKWLEEWLKAAHLDLNPEPKPIKKSEKKIRVKKEKEDEEETEVFEVKPQEKSDDRSTNESRTEESTLPTPGGQDIG
jgi:hypothetical protein